MVASRSETLGVDRRAIVKKETSFGELEGKTLGSSKDELSDEAASLPLFSIIIGESKDNSDKGLLVC